MLKTLDGLVRPPLGTPSSDPFRHTLAIVLRRSSVRLGRWARALGGRSQTPAGQPQLEFHAEAGAPEGALYVDGQLVGHLPGVHRL